MLSPVYRLDATPENEYSREHMSMKPRVVVIGAGSYFFGRKAIWHMCNSPVLRNGELVLVDTNEQTLDTMVRLGRRTAEALQSPTTIRGTTDRREALPDADFVVLAFSNQNARFRGVDTRIAAKYGVRMCSSDTIGPGGIFRAMREIPTVLAVARDCEELCPHAWLINYVNPSAVIGMALRRYSRMRSFAICDSLYEPNGRLRHLRDLGIIPEDASEVPPEVEAKLDMAIAGVNHFTWLLRLAYDGIDMMPRIREIVDARADDERRAGGANEHGITHSKAKYNNCYAADLFSCFGILPVVISHAKEYVPYFQGYGKNTPLPEPIELFDAEQRQEQMDAFFAETREYADGSKPIDDFLASGTADPATDIIETMWGNLPRSFYISTANRNAVSNMTSDAFLELRCDLDMQGPRPQPVGEMPRGVRGLQEQILDTHELTAEAAAEFDRAKVLRAFVSDPIVNNTVDARAMIEELFEAQSDALDDRWYA